MDWQLVSGDTSVEPESTTLDDQVAEIYAWRLEQLVRAGYSARNAGLLADDETVDLHEACDLLERACPESTAVRILVEDA